uniref:Uncharacterized protein n=1 Tax=Vannella robusta TaxID=1487602 RepID=A0A7S4MIF7_9EUKA
MSDMDPYDVYVPGKLKLKKIAVDKTIKKKKRRKKKKVQMPEVDKDEEKIILPEDTRTDMEKRVAKAKEERERKKIEELARKSYRERVEEYNQHLDELTEHFDVPKVGPG